MPSPPASSGRPPRPYRPVLWALAPACRQVHVVAATLREAQERPEEYQNLLVWVTGYNAHCVGLGKEIQDEIIARESHQL